MPRKISLAITLELAILQYFVLQQETGSEEIGRLRAA
jgi:hypothetical protein